MSSRRSGRRAGVIAVSVLACALAPAVVAPVALAAEADEPVTFTIGTTQTATANGTNPFLATAGADYLLMPDVYDLLLEFGPNLEPVPGIAESYETSDDGLTWTYTIREGVTFHDGEPLTADDVAYTFNYILNSQNPEYTGPEAPDGNDVDGDGSADNGITLFNTYLDLDLGYEETAIESVEATDDTTVVISLREPLITLSQIYIPILPRHVWEGVTFEQASGNNPDDTFTNFDPEAGHPVGTGPFRLVEFRENEVMRLEKNSDYWGGEPRIGELIYQYFENDEALVNALRSGEIDMINVVPASLVSTLEGDPNITLQRSPASDFIELGFNSWDPTPERFEAEGCADCPRGPTTGSLGNPWLTRTEVRAALASLLDKQELVERALSGYGTPGVSVVGPFNQQFHYAPEADDPLNFPAYSDENDRQQARQQATERFRQSMAALGFNDTDGDGVLNVPDTAEAQEFDPVRTVSFSDSGDTEVGAGRNFKLRLFVRDDDEEDKVAAELIEAWYEEAGVDVDRQLVREDPQLYDASYPSSTNADMDMYIWGWGPDPDPDFILSVFSCAQINNWQDVNYCNEEYDELYASTKNATSQEERRQAILDAQEFIFHESPYAVLWYVDSLEAYRSDRWEGFQPHPENGYLWTSWGFGPYGSRTTVAPLGATGASPSPGESAAASGSPGQSGAPSPGATDGASAAPSGAGGTGAGAGDGSMLLVGGAALIAALVVGGAVIARRRSAADDEE